MIRQRSESAAPAVRACAEELPFADGAFGASLAVLTIQALLTYEWVPEDVVTVRVLDGGGARGTARQVAERCA
jgi:hypothetical protein